MRRAPIESAWRESDLTDIKWGIVAPMIPAGPARRAQTVGELLMGLRGSEKLSVRKVHRR